jgi:3-isopropylmalate dehydrogenase
MKLMFEWFGEKYNDKKIARQSIKIEKAIDQLFRHNIRTKDIGGQLSTFEFNDKFIQILEQEEYE